MVASFCAVSNQPPHCPCPCEVLPLCENFAHANEPELLNDTQRSSQYVFYEFCRCISRYFKVFQGISRYFKVLQGCFKVFQGVSMYES